MSLNLAFARLKLLTHLKSLTRLKFTRVLDLDLNLALNLKPKFKAKFSPKGEFKAEFRAQKGLEKSVCRLYTSPITQNLF